MHYRFIETNEMFERITQMHDVTGKTLHEVFAGKSRDSDKWIAHYGAMVLENSEYTFEEHSQNLQQWFYVYAATLRDEEFVTFFIDITHIKETDTTIERLSSALDMVESYIYIKDTDSRYVYANKATRDLLGKTHQTIKGARDGEVFSESVVNVLKALDAKALNGAKTNEEVEVSLDNGETRHFMELKAPIYEESDHPTGIIGIANDITRRKQLEMEIQQLLIIDDMTGVYNRRHVFSKIHSALNVNTHFTFAIIDIDHFKQINDTYGHLVGDKVLTTFAEQLQKHFETGTVGRFGGEEFMIFMNDTDQFTLSESIKRFLQKLNREPLTIDNHTLTLTFTAGVCEAHETQRTIDAIIALADYRLYEGKAQGRNQVVCYNSFLGV